MRRFFRGALGRTMLLGVILSCLGPAVAQPTAGPNPSAVADEAVRQWLQETPPDLMSLAGLPPDELCRQLPAVFQSMPPVAGTEVNFGDQQQLPSDEPGVRHYSYPASLPGGQLRLVEVTVRQEAGRWEATSVGYHTEAAVSTIPAFVHSTLASWLFILFSLYLLSLLVRPSYFRRWLAEGWRVMVQHRRTVILTIVVLYGLFGLGAVTGAALPAACKDAISSFLQGTLEQLGATQAYASQDIPRAATVTFYQNFIWGTLITTFIWAFLFAVPAYLVNGLRFFSLGVPFGFAGFDVASLLVVLVLLIIELMAYILVTAGGG
ncbi:MAG TPA: hypothetical protein VF171_02110, partial [Trueperaceae bacterium]